MKFKKFGKAVLTGALSAGVVFGVSSCVQSYTTGYLYVTGTITVTPAGNGIISGFRIDHNTGQLSAINTSPFSSEGANPIRAVLTTGSRFLYVLNRGLNASGNGDCTSSDPCQNANITQFALGGNGNLTFQESFSSEGTNPFRMILDTSGNYLLVLDHDAPDSNALTGKSAASNSCSLALGASVTSCADVTVFLINSTTGRLSVVLNQQVTAASGQQLTYFPIPANPVDFVLSTSSLLTLTGSAPSASFPYTGGASVFPYAYNSTDGQLTLSQNSAQPLGIGQGTAIINAGGNIYVLDNEPTTYTNNGATDTAVSQILAYTVGINGALSAQVTGVIPDDSNAGNPIYLMEEAKSKFIYVANQGNNTLGPTPNSDITGYSIEESNPFNVGFTTPPTFPIGSGPQCMVEDPSDQYIYTANLYDSTVSGRILDPEAGELYDLRVNSEFPLSGPATWCLIDGRVG